MQKKIYSTDVDSVIIDKADGGESVPLLHHIIVNDPKRPSLVELVIGNIVQTEHQMRNTPDTFFLVTLIKQYVSSRQ